MIQPLYPLQPHLKLVLASQSPRRKQLLSQLGYVFTTVHPHVDETPPMDQEPENWVPAIAKKKALAAAAMLEYPDDTLILAADTVVVLNNDWLGKPRTPKDALRYLKRLSGKKHQVMTGLALWSKTDCMTNVTKTNVHFHRLDDNVIERYAHSGEPIDKAGGYAIQGQGATFVERIDGCYFNVVGLPLQRLIALLDDMHALKVS